MIQGMREATQYILVEIKNCRDTDPTGQQDRATTQHESLRNLIKQHTKPMLY
jgi:hypothetical protein